ncbi:MAG TPA: carboxypeptidase, partial [Thermoanaerobaculia bacterium]|nr:carboxypeptidase [Thermoanaerobaculia bacterium]
MSDQPLLLAAAFVVFAAVPAQAAERPPHFDALPPELPWAGASLELAVPADDPWATPFEAGGMVDSPSYDETVAWLRRLVAASPNL